MLLTQTITKSITVFPLKGRSPPPPFKFKVYAKKHCYIYTIVRLIEQVSYTTD